MAILPASPASPDQPGRVQWQSEPSPLSIRVTTGESGPVLMLSGEGDTTSLAQLEEALAAQIASGGQTLTVGLSGLEFADSATIGALCRAARTLKAQGRRLELANPRPILSRMLSLLGVDQILTVRYDSPVRVHGTSDAPAPDAVPPDE